LNIALCFFYDLFFTALSSCERQTEVERQNKALPAAKADLRWKLKISKKRKGSAGI